jgi:excisionase family DNA binding protein
VSPSGDNEPLLNAEDVARIIGLSPGWVYAQVRDGRMPHIRLGRYVRFRRSTIESWLAHLEVPATES